MDADHPLQQAWSDYQFARANALPCRAAKARLRRELALEQHITRVLVRQAGSAGSPLHHQQLCAERSAA
jgi:hypothetical protein